MIFDGRPISEISDDEINGLVVNHMSERQHLEFKITINYRDDEGRIELLRDIVSLANGGGGYLIVGVRDDGKGKAQKYEPDLVGDTERTKKSIMSLCNDHISERIDGLEVVTREVGGNPLVVARVPVSDRVPHMVTYRNRTDFCTRYHDGKREMTIGEIREFFTQDLVGRRLTTIETYLRQIITDESLDRERDRALQRIQEGASPQFLTIENGTVLSEAAFEAFRTETQDTPYFWMAATPVSPRANAVDVDSDTIRNLLRNPPGSRYGGWNMDAFSMSVQRFAEGVRGGFKDYRYMHLLENGHAEFWSPLNETFCWNQSPEEFRQRPRLYPYPVTEIPTTFLRLYRAILGAAELTGAFLVTLHYRNLKGYTLPPYSPRAIGFAHPSIEPQLFDGEHLVVPVMQVSHNFEPDKVAYDLIRYVYATFEHGPDTIPFFNRDTNLFTFQ